jgi:hypothetical protein
MVNMSDELVHSDAVVTSLVVRSDIVAVATSEIFPPAATEVSPRGDVVIAIDCGIAAVTVTVAAVVALIPIQDALIVAEPVAIPAVTSPVVDTVAGAAVNGLHVAYPVMFTNVPLSNVPVKVSCCCWPAASVTVDGEMLSPVKCPGLTVSCVEAETGVLDPLGVKLAVIVVVPAPATAIDPALTVATPNSDVDPTSAWLKSASNVVAVRPVASTTTIWPLKNVLVGNADNPTGSPAVSGLPAA